MRLWPTRRIYKLSGNAKGQPQALPRVCRAYNNRFVQSISARRS